VELASPKRVLAVMLHPLGGIRTYILYNYPTLVRAGYRFTFVAPEGEQFDTLRRDLQSFGGAEFVAVPAGHPLAGRGKCSLRTATRKLLKSGQYSLVHSHGFSAAIMTFLANWGIGVPHAFTSHDVIRPRTQFPGIFGMFKRLAIAQMLARIDRVITVSRDAKENHLQFLPALRRRSAKVITIINGIDTQRFCIDEDSSAGQLRAGLGISRDCFLIGFLGRFMEQKGFLYLIEAMDRLLARGVPPRPVHLLAVGSGDFLVNYRWELDRYPRVKSCITFADHIPDVKPVLTEIDLLAMPSLWEACPLLPMEAMCAGVPVLGTDCIGLREVLDGTPSRMVPAADAGALATALDQAMRAPWTEAARHYAPEARRRFDVGPAAVRLQELFDELAG
jgi:glycosyltransferase involved in cell wall biosynthesis